MIVMGALLVLVVGWLFVRRAKKRRQLAGIEANKPVYSVQPPGGRLSRLKDTRL